MTGRLIDADALYTLFVKMKSFGELSAKKAIRCVEEAPTVDAEPVRHGIWIDKWSGDGEVWLEQRCSECGIVFEDEPHDYKYCPCCGAKMDAQEKDDDRKID